MGSRPPIFKNIPPPARDPTAAQAQSVAAVLSPEMLAPCLMMTPAPRKPIPEATCAATRVGSPAPNA